MTVERARKGAKATAAKLAKARSMREWAILYGSLPMERTSDVPMKDPKSAKDLKESNPTMDGAVIAAMYKKAINGDTKAAEFLAKLKGQTGEDVTVHIDTMAQMDTADLLRLYERTKARDD